MPFSAGYIKSFTRVLITILSTHVDESFKLRGLLMSVDIYWAKQVKDHEYLGGYFLCDQFSLQKIPKNIHDPQLFCSVNLMSKDSKVRSYS